MDQRIPHPPQPPQPAGTLPVSRGAKEQHLGQRGVVIWLYGLSGAGKSTLAEGLERELVQQGRVTMLLDGDELRGGLNQGLGFSDADRAENLRRAAEVARLLVRSGIIVIAAFITPRREHRALVRGIIGAGDFLEIHVSASFEVCAQRDPKGLYARAARNQVAQFTGRDSIFEAPTPGEAALTLDTGGESAAQSLVRLVDFVTPHLAPRRA